MLGTQVSILRPGYPRIQWYETIQSEACLDFETYTLKVSLHSRIGRGTGIEASFCSLFLVPYSL
jgi:hypothetical protein